jgi:hypothetical protein
MWCGSARLPVPPCRPRTRGDDRARSPCGGLWPEVEYAAPGVMVTAFIDGADLGRRTCAPNRRAIARLLRRFHEEMAAHGISGPAFLFWPFHVIRDYVIRWWRQQPHGETGCRNSSNWRTRWRRCKSRCLSSSGTTTCCRRTSFTMARLWLIDFEYAGFRHGAVRPGRGIASNAELAMRPRRCCSAYTSMQPRPQACARFDAMQVAVVLARDALGLCLGTSPRGAGCRLPRLCRRQPGEARCQRCTPIEAKWGTGHDPSGKAQIVVIGGGIIGCSTAYHLARDHKADVLLLEQGKLTSGSTWHAAGLVGQLRSSASITQVLKYSVELYKRLAEETGLETGWKMTGCLRLATTRTAGPSTAAWPRPRAASGWRCTSCRPMR